MNFGIWHRVVGWLVVCAAYFGGMPLALHAEEAPRSPLRIEVLQSSLPRSEAPVPIQVQMKPVEPAIVEGRLEFRLMHGREHMGTLTTEDIAVPVAGQTMRWLLPALNLRGGLPQFDLRITVITKSGRYQHKPISLRLQSPTQRSFVAGVVAPEAVTFSKDLNSLLDTLRFETYSGYEARKQNLPESIDRSIVTTVTRIRPGELPTEPLEYCTYNMLVLAEDGFTALPRVAAESIQQWVEAGGSLLVLPRGVLEGWQVVWLNELASSSKAPRFVSRPDGSLLPPEAGISPFYLMQRGLGRVVVVSSTASQPLLSTSREWRRCLHHLWRIRLEHRPDFMETGKWSAAILDRDSQYYNYYKTQAGQGYNTYRRDHPTGTPLGYNPIVSGDELVNRIVPNGLRLVPLSLVGLILFVYILLISPLEFAILGRYKLRKWTWITFPVLTAICTFAIFQLTEFYMNVGDNKRSLIVADIGEQGVINRVNELQLTFNSRQRVVETRVDNSLLTPVAHSSLGTGAWQYHQLKMGGQSQWMNAEEPQYNGRYPAHYTVEQRLPQWTPQLNRRLTFSDNSLTPEINWQQYEYGAAVDWKSIVADNERVQQIKSSLQKQFGSQARIAIYQSTNVYILTGEVSLLGAPRHHSKSHASQQENLSNLTASGVRIYTQNDLRQDFISDLSVLRDGGLFSVVSQISPHGGHQLEDFSLLDPSDYSQWLLVVAVPEGQNLVLYRKLYTGTR